ncbi:MAG TPA: sugar ABC transporter permease [Thermodesulfobacteriota bacterium]|nr:sugar ABC transporter permease [Thermodesulfobacteriota bacterium]
MSGSGAFTPVEVVEARARTFSLKGLLERQSSLGVILMLPGALLLMVFMAYPFFLGIWLALTDSVIGTLGNFIGIRNFSDLITDTVFHQTARNTFVYALVTVPFKAILGLGMALVLNNRIRFSNPIRAAVMMPWIVPTALSSLGWFMIFDPVFSPISWLLKNLGLIKQNINFLGGPNLAIASVCLANIWRGIPFFGITILAGLQAVPQELHEAAAIDGAGVWHRFRHVTIPAIKGVVLIAALLSIIWTFADFQLIYVLTKGGPANTTHIFGTYAYQIGLSATEIGMGAAISLYMFPILTFFAILLLIYLRKED